jgi:hypothetical protein
MEVTSMPPSSATTDALKHFDCVIMLTWSNWFTEMRSNRYNYALRFSRHLPVIFVQPDLYSRHWFFDRTELTNVSILQVSRDYGKNQTPLLKSALDSKGFKKPLFWMYNFLFDDFFTSQTAILKIYHATEDYFSNAFSELSPSLPVLKHSLSVTDLLVCVSDGVSESYRHRGGYAGEIYVAENGCDFAFWSQPSRSVQRQLRTCLYQGGIHKKINFELLLNVVEQLHDWTFIFCGQVNGDHRGWRTLIGRQNVKYLGQLPAEAAVGD